MIDFDTEQDHFFNTLGTGDIIFFEGAGIFSWTVKLFTLGEKWTHVGVIYIHPITYETYVMESYKNGPAIDIITGNPKKDGVQVTLLKERLKEYQYHIGIRRLNIDIENLTTILWNITIEVKDYKYPIDVGYFIKGGYRLNDDTDYKSFYCVQFVGYLLCKSGILPEFKYQNALITTYTSLPNTPYDILQEIKL